MVFGGGRLKVVGIGGTLREGSSSLGALRRALEAAKEAGVQTELLDLRERAAANTTDAMVHVVHVVTISKARQRSDGEGNITDQNYRRRLEKLGTLVVEMAEGLNPENRRVGVAV